METGPTGATYLKRLVENEGMEARDDRPAFAEEVSVIIEDIFTKTLYYEQAFIRLLRHHLKFIRPNNTAIKCARPATTSNKRVYEIIPSNKATIAVDKAYKRSQVLSIIHFTGHPYLQN